MTGKRVLVVDDDRSLLRLIDHWLTNGGYEVEVCASFQNAKERLALSSPDVLLTDVRLGAFNGLQLVILAKDLHPAIVAVVMSAYDDPVLRKEASQAGASSYLPKPFSVEAILNLVSNGPSGEAMST